MILLRYHNSCYRQLMHEAGKTSSSGGYQSQQNMATPSTSGYRHYEDSFQEFVEDVMEKRMLKGSQVMSVKKLKKLFKQKVKQVDKTNLSRTYKTTNLKSRLVTLYLNIVFAKHRSRSKSQIAYFPRKTGESIVVDQDDVETTSESSDSEPESSDEEATLSSGAISGPETHNSKSEEQWRNIFLSAISVKNSINDASKFSPSWPPTSSDMTEDKIFEIVPPQLYNFIAWICDVSDDFDTDHVKVTNEKKIKILSIAQDILALADKDHAPPKHIMLGMSVRHITGSKRITDILNGLGHSVSHTTVQRIDTDIASAEIQCSIPTTLITKKFTTLVWDNIDFQEETFSGHNTTHCVNVIAIQNSDMQPNIKLNCRRSRKRALESQDSHLLPYQKRRKVDPEIIDTKIESPDERLQWQAGQLKDNIYYIMKTLDTRESLPLPNWTGFNTEIQNFIPQVSKITYLPLIDGNATDMATINTILHRSLELAYELEIPQVVIVADQAIYAKVQQIRWADVEFQERIVVRLGEFHTVMAFLSTLGMQNLICILF